MPSNRDGMAIILVIIICFNWLVSSHSHSLSPSLARIRPLAAWHIHFDRICFYNTVNWWLLSSNRMVVIDYGTAEPGFRSRVFPIVAALSKRKICSAHYSRPFHFHVNYQQHSCAFWYCVVSRYNLLNAQTQCKQFRREYWVASMIKCTPLFALKTDTYSLHAKLICCHWSPEWWIISLSFFLALSPFIRKWCLTTSMNTWMTDRWNNSTARKCFRFKIHLLTLMLVHCSGIAWR